MKSIKKLSAKHGIQFEKNHKRHASVKNFNIDLEEKNSSEDIPQESTECLKNFFESYETKQLKNKFHSHQNPGIQKEKEKNENNKEYSAKNEPKPKKVMIEDSFISSSFYSGDGNNFASKQIIDSPLSSSGVQSLQGIITKAKQGEIRTMRGILSSKHTALEVIESKGRFNSTRNPREDFLLLNKHFNRIEKKNQ